MQQSEILLSVPYPGGFYPIHVKRGIMGRLGNLLRDVGVSRHVAVVSNPTVCSLYGAEVETQLRKEGLSYHICMIPDGERYKTVETVAALYGQFLDGGLDRSGTVLSLGGGVTSDIAGFAAATYMRGISFVQVPTTLIAMVDASVGGKTGVNLPQGKNLVGAFTQPLLVAIDPDVLVTLPEEEIRSGMAEIIKHGVIGDPELFAETETATRGSIDWTRWIVRSLRVKIIIVEEDPFEQGRRAVLKLGHTVGYALEQLSGFRLRHGEAVSIGMVAVARIAVALGRANASLLNRLTSLLSSYDLPVSCPPFDPVAIWETIKHDKKKRGQTLHWVLPRIVGEVEIVEGVPQTVVLSVMSDLGAGQ